MNYNNKYMNWNLNQNSNQNVNMINNVRYPEQQQVDQQMNNYNRNTYYNTYVPVDEMQIQIQQGNNSIRYGYQNGMSNQNQMQNQMYQNYQQQQQQQQQQKQQQQMQYQQQKQYQYQYQLQQEQNNQRQLQMQQEQEKQRQIQLLRQEEQRRIQILRQQEHQRQMQLQQQQEKEQQQQFQLQQQQREQHRQYQFQKQQEEEQQSQYQYQQQQNQQKQLQLKRQQEEEVQRQLQYQKQQEEEKQRQIQIRKQQEEERQRQIQLRKQQEEEKLRQMQLRKQQEEEQKRKYQQQQQQQQQQQRYYQEQQSQYNNQLNYTQQQHIQNIQQEQQQQSQQNQNYSGQYYDQNQLNYSMQNNQNVNSQYQNSYIDNSSSNQYLNSDNNNSNVNNSNSVNTSNQQYQRNDNNNYSYLSKVGSHSYPNTPPNNQNNMYNYSNSDQNVLQQQQSAQNSSQSQNLPDFNQLSGSSDSQQKIKRRKRMKNNKEQEVLEQQRFEQQRFEQQRLKQKRLEQERLEQERMEQERLEQERLEQERLERERIERERLEQERLEQERLEQERLKQQRLEQERLEQQRLEQERLERERLEQERLERERLERERLEQEKLEKEKLEQQRLEQEKLEQERLEQQRLEQEKLEQQKIEQQNLQQSDINNELKTEHKDSNQMSLVANEASEEVQIPLHVILWSFSEEYITETQKLISLSTDPSDQVKIQNLILTAIKCLLSILNSPICKQLITPKVEAKTRFKLGEILYIYTNNYYEAEQHIQKAYMLCRKLNYIELKYRIVDIHVKISEKNTSKTLSETNIYGLIKQAANEALLEKNIYWYYYFQLKALSRLYNLNKQEFLSELDSTLNVAYENMDSEITIVLLLYRVQFVINNKNLNEMEQTFKHIDKLMEIIVNFVFTNTDENIIPTFPYKNSLIYLVYDYVLKSYGYYKLGNNKLAFYYLNQVYEINKKYAEIIPSAILFCDVPINDEKFDHIDISFISEHQLYSYILFLTRKLKIKSESKEIVKYLEKEISNIQLALDFDKKGVFLFYEDIEDYKDWCINQKGNLLKEIILLLINRCDYLKSYNYINDYASVPVKATEVNNKNQQLALYLGYLNHSLGNVDNAKIWYQNILKMIGNKNKNSNIGLLSKINLILLNKATGKLNNNNMESEVTRLIGNNDDNQYKLSLLVLKSVVYTFNNELRKSRTNLFESIKIMENTESSHIKVYALLVLGLNLYVINPPQAEEIFYTAFLIAQKNQMIYLSYILTNILKEYYKNVNKMKESEEYEKINIQYQHVIGNYHLKLTQNHTNDLIILDGKCLQDVFSITQVNATINGGLETDFIKSL
ncbi:hypothetical protein BCR32DRAFT_284596 [Anaeromyces robustus]|uniref:Uncharacterized protein n=1 Tax=Anaeromyces robustus TaxID=1754192 RepID=A0A1Y1WR86_9FUNG|nr:hypothetical protein BCR32DRAFT_284596 [Anaeromyces robustus]|eukprot:ORX76049.1 hypothetical protein BCR32DRAFT_284596 [Anaeromyces robustus]